MFRTEDFCGTAWKLTEMLSPTFVFTKVSQKQIRKKTSLSSRVLLTEELNPAKPRAQSVQKHQHWHQFLRQMKEFKASYYYFEPAKSLHKLIPSMIRVRYSLLNSALKEREHAGPSLTPRQSHFFSTGALEAPHYQIKIFPLVISNFFPLVIMFNFEIFNTGCIKLWAVEY